MPALETYRAKRDFGKTAEPRGGRVAKARSKALKFVIQRHDATRLHFDFRLELDGVYKSWAVTKVPSLDPATKRLAVEVEDHPIEYGTFEGTIPQGQYGGGTVQLWDRGTWEPQGEDPRGDLKDGHIKIILHGERLHGRWALVRMKDDPAKPGRKVRHNWLLIKEKDEEARPGEPETLLAADTSVATGRTLDEIANAKKPRIWNSNRGDFDGSKKKSETEPVQKAVTAEKARPQKIKRVAMPDFVEPQLTRLVETPPTGASWVHEVKFDGYRMQLRVEKGRAALRTRKALDWSARFPEIVKEGRHLPACIVDGEICAVIDDVPSFSALQEALSEGKTDALIFYIFDLLFLEGADVREQPLAARKELLKVLIEETNDIPHFHYAEHFAGNGEAMLESACKAHLEGIVSKRTDAPYRSGRSDLWTKAKCRGGQEIVIGGWWGDTKNLRSLLMGVWRGEDFVYLGRTGTGFNSENSGPLLRKLVPLNRSTSPFTAGVKPPRTKEINWVEPKLVAEVEYATITADGLLRQTAFKALREDKPARSVVLELPTQHDIAEERAETEKDMPAKNAVKSAPTKKGDAVVSGITITHPDKALWPAAGKSAPVTKLDLARYYEATASRMLPHIAGRPISMVRAPDGIGGQRFYQRHVLAGVKGAMPIKVAGEKEPYHSTDSVEGLVSLAQVAVLEIHPWGCKKNDPETPERLIFDLDPSEELGFERVIEAAQDMRALLEKIGFTPFVKTTGGKGLHVVIAIKGTPKKPATWPEGKAFALAAAEKLAASAPGRYVTNMSKKLRVGKIFVDYLRNDLSATAVAPWSPRARDGATIATPLPWSAIKKGLDPKAFTIATVAAVLRRADPWADLAASAISLDAAAKKLEKL